MIRIFNKTFSVLSILILASCGHNLPDYTARLSSRLPTTDKSEAIGEYALGCLKGAQTFNGEEKGLLISQLKRGRYWGHPNLVKLLTRAGVEFDKSHQKIIIGDMSQSRGGPTITGHNSHQTGLDVDIWFQILEKNEKFSFVETETKDMPSVKELNSDQIKLIKYFANASEVERIFINPAFKKKLCESGNLLTESELHKLRAWWGHDDHIHVRLKCPGDSPSCITQNPIPEGSGCNDLARWFTDEARNSDKDVSWNDLKSMYLEKVKKLPAACEFYSETF